MHWYWQYRLHACHMAKEVEFTQQALGRAQWCTHGVCNESKENECLLSSAVRTMRESSCAAGGCHTVRSTTSWQPMIASCFCWASTLFCQRRVPVCQRGVFTCYAYKCHFTLSHESLPRRWTAAALGDVWVCGRCSSSCAGLVWSCTEERSAPGRFKLTQSQSWFVQPDWGCLPSVIGSKTV